MPLIILTGYPCSGLTHRATQLSTLLQKTQDTLLSAEKNRYKIHIVPSHDGSNPRTFYDNARTEKQARGVAYARAKRALGKDSIVILDGMNYIKGWRYQLWCEAKALGTTCCVVHVGTPIDQCIANNETRIQRQKTKQDQEEKEPNAGSAQQPREDTPPKEQDSYEKDTEEAYPPDLLNNLIFRYEEPSMHSRWDKPLFTVPWEDEQPPVAEIWTALTGIPHSSSSEQTPSDEKDSDTIVTSLSTTTISDTASNATGATTRTTAGGISTRPRPKIQPHAATVQAAHSDSSALYSMEKRTSTIITAIRTFTSATPSAETALAQSTSSQGISIPVPTASVPIFIPAHIATTGTTDELAGAGGILALPRLQRLRRQWIGLNRAYVGGNYGAGKGGLSEDQIGDAFVRFLNSRFEGGEGN